MRQISAFRSLRRDCTRLTDRKMSWIVSKGRATVFLSNIEAGTSVKSQFKKVCAMIFINFTILMPKFSIQILASLSTSKNHKICENHGTFLLCESTCDLTDVPPLMYDRKTAARHFDNMRDILRSLSLPQYLLQGQNAAAGTNAYATVGNRRVKVIQNNVISPLIVNLSNPVRATLTSVQLGPIGVSGTAARHRAENRGPKNESANVDMVM